MVPFSIRYMFGLIWFGLQSKPPVARTRSGVGKRGREGFIPKALQSLAANFRQRHSTLKETKC